MGIWQNDDYQPILLGRLRIRVVNAATGSPLPGVRVAVDDDLPCAQQQGWGAKIAVTGRDGIAEFEIPFGHTFAALSEETWMQAWIGVDEVIDLVLGCSEADVISNLLSPKLPS